jgi:predicted AAA+ superfamily ATPase
MINLARYLVSASGSKISINKLSKIFGIAKDTLQLYVNYMIDAYLLFEVTYFSYSVKVKHDVTKLVKLYCVDLGLMHAVNTQYSKNEGQVFENAVCIKLIETHSELSYWNEIKSEVNFIAGKMIINVTASDKIAEREFKGLNDFSEKHRGFMPILISKSLKKDNIIPLRDFLKQD